MAQTVADRFERTLAAAGIRWTHGILGDSLDGPMDATWRRHKIGWIHVRQNEVTTFVASAETYLTDELVVCAVSHGRVDQIVEQGQSDSWR